MPIRVTVAKTPELIDDVFKIRHKILSDPKTACKSEKGRMVDRFDAYPTTANLIVIDNDEPIGSLQMTLDSGVGLPTDDQFDFRQHVPTPHKLMSCDYFCVSPDHNTARISVGLWLMATYFAHTKEVTHVVALLDPSMGKLLYKIGFKEAKKSFKDAETGQEIEPMILDMRDLNDFFLNFAIRNHLKDYIGEYERLFYKADEYVIRTGEPGNCAFLIIDGTAHARLPNSDRVMTVLREGDIFGELALITDDIRSADVIAATNLSVMTISRDVFMNHLMGNPLHAVNIMRLMGERSKRQMAELTR